jgi:hypothetical protein
MEHSLINCVECLVYLTSLSPVPAVLWRNIVGIRAGGGSNPISGALPAPSARVSTSSGRWKSDPYSQLA